jgi:NADPH-dependent 2,4-dienoyl-CoA reductase/sulfur reductase-like enzyme
VAPRAYPEPWSCPGLAARSWSLTPEARATPVPLTCTDTSRATDTLSADERTQLLARGIGVVEGTIDQLVIDDADQLRGVQMRDGCVLPVDALFVPPRFVPNSTLLVGLGCDVDTDGWVTVDTTGRTSVPGVWAAGNIADPRAQVITAAGAGAGGGHRHQRRRGRRRRAQRRPRPRPGFAVTAIPNTH